MTRFRSLTIGALVAALLATGIAFAQGPGGPGRGSRGPGMRGPGMILRGLNLTEAQQQQVREIRDRHRADLEAAHKQLAAARTAQRKAVEAVPFDEGAIRATVQQVADAETEAAIQQARVFNDVWSVLTPDQQAQAKKLQAEREQRMAQRQQRTQQQRQR